MSITLVICSANAQTITEIKELDWFSDEASYYIDKNTGVWSIGEIVTVIDVETGISFQAARRGGTNHADYEPATQEDTDKLKEIYGEWSWNRRAVIVIIDGEAFAGSMNGMPHGNYSISDNGYNGHSCIHFSGSRTHGTNRVDKAHQTAIQTALDTDIDELNRKMEVAN